MNPYVHIIVVDQRYYQTEDIALGHGDFGAPWCRLFPMNACICSYLIKIQLTTVKYDII